jgi:hypothetical protein
MMVVGKIINNKLHGNKLYICGVLLLFTFTYLLNFCTAIYQCALMFTIIAITTNSITSLYSKSKSLYALAFAIIVNFVFLGKLPYYIDGTIVNGLVFASFSSLMISMYWSSVVFQKLTKTLGFIKSNALSLILSSVIDGFIMGVFFILNNKFSHSRVLDIFSREVSYKIAYILAASFMIHLFVKMFKNRDNLSHNLGR